ncbi:NLRC3-like isoform X1 [Pelobates cultripes]|nr:NLRC3-like isoform X1 [Pelobates cultripes]
MMDHFRTFFITLFGLFLGCPSMIIRTTLHSNVLLPCILSYKKPNSSNDLVVNWQRLVNETVVHSFFEGSDHPEYQNRHYRGRTEIFHNQLSEGNMSLLLRNVIKYDNGSYTCNIMFNDYIEYITHHIQLVVQDSSSLLQDAKINNADDKDLPRARYKLYLLAFTLVLVLLLWLDNERKKKEEEEEIQNYRNNICAMLTSEDFEFQRDLHIVDINKNSATNDKRYFDLTPKINAKDLLKNKNLVSERMLLVGNSGTGKSFLCKLLQKKWANGKKMAYKCILYLSCKKMTCNQEFSVKQLLKEKCKAPLGVVNKCKASSPFSSNSYDLLLIIDNVDDVYHNEDDSLMSRCSIDTVYKVKDLLLKIFKRELIAKIDVLCVSNFDTFSELKMHFKRAFVFSGNSGVKTEELFAEIGKTSDIKKDPRKETELLNCASMPHFINTVKIMMCKYLKNPFSPSKIYIHMFLCCLQEINDKELEVTVFKQKANMAYKSLIEKQTLEKGDQDDILMKNWNEVLNTCTVYQHNVLRDILAAIHCVWTIQTDEELKECLNFWVFAKNSQNKIVLIPAHSHVHNAKVFHFIKFFLILLVYPDYESLKSCDKPVMESNVRDALMDWFSASLEKYNTTHDHLKLINCLYDLEDEQIRKRVSPFFKKLNFCNTSLTYMDIQALAYSLKDSKLDELDLRLCTLKDTGVTQLKGIIKNTKNVLLSSNKITQESGYVLSEVLRDPECITEEMSLGTNDLGASGVQALWEALGKNKTLKKLYLYDNKIGDEGTKGMITNLNENNVLQELHLCGNTFDEMGLKNIEQLKIQKRNLKVVLRIAEDVQLFNYVEEEIQSLSKTWQNYDQDWLFKILETIQNDLSKEYTWDPNVLKEKILNLSKRIDDLKTRIHPNHMSFMCLKKTREQCAEP